MPEQKRSRWFAWTVVLGTLLLVMLFHRPGPYVEPIRGPQIVGTALIDTRATRLATTPSPSATTEATPTADY